MKIRTCPISRGILALINVVFLHVFVFPLSIAFEFEDGTSHLILIFGLTSHSSKGYLSI